MKKRTSLITLIAAIGAALPAYAQAEEKIVLSFGIVPQQSAIKLARKWTPIFHYLGKKTGYSLRFKTAPNIPTFEKRVSDQQYDIAYMNPYHYTTFAENPGYTAFAKQKDKKIKGIIVVHKDSTHQTLGDLSKQQLAFPAPAAFAASVLPRSKMGGDGVTFTPNYVSSHDSVYRTVAKGIFTAGGGIKRTFNNVDPAIRQQLRILWTTPGYTPHAFAARPGLDPQVIHNLQQAMVEMSDDPAANHLLKAINFKGFTPANNGDWDDVRSLNITQLLGELISR
uniref:Putative periplasmic binding protein-related protein n=1 Tax=Magnetococcus massalia (strain MO-1) TaxID=451514 RepID=A0A1S7LNY5_MAGMO|nr:Putative periplasmic binding protein-related protein [Candidatus Magnetococcus massalia]